MTSSGAHTYFEHQDWTGTTRLRTDYAGNVAGSMATLPFGDGTSLSINNSYAEAETAHFAMQDKDFYGASDSGTNHALFRQYMDTIGSWMSPDPYMGSYDPSNPQSMNRYSYVGNNPLTYVDPDGTSGCQDGDFGCIVNEVNDLCTGLGGCGDQNGDTWWGGYDGLFGNEQQNYGVTDGGCPMSSDACSFMYSYTVNFAVGGVPYYPQHGGGGTPLQGAPNNQTNNSGCSVLDTHCVKLGPVARYGAFLNCEAGIWTNDLGSHGAAVFGTSYVAINATRKMFAKVVFGDAVKVSNIEAGDALFVAGMGLLESVKANETCSNIYGYAMW